jgi:hypothetical protein
VQAAWTGVGSWGLVVPEGMKTLSQADDKEFITTQIWYSLRGLDVHNSCFFHIAVLDMSPKGPSCMRVRARTHTHTHTHSQQRM